MEEHFRATTYLTVDITGDICKENVAFIIGNEARTAFYTLKQGPALYGYNDATFSKDDWKGIRMICDSINVKDPMKVGRFGLGFKSIFHMTGIEFTRQLFS